METVCGECVHYHDRPVEPGNGLCDKVVKDGERILYVKWKSISSIDPSCERYEERGKG